MTISLAAATATLLGGKQLSWAAFKEHRAGALTLSEPGPRRLFAFLLAQDREVVARGDEELFSGLIASWNEDSVDPATDAVDHHANVSGAVWRLNRIEASGFGGLTLFGGRPFDLQVNGENWCLYGQNGSGKTSLTSAVIWALTGKRIREQEGLVDENGERSSVTDEAGNKLGDWPSFVSYPSAISDLGKAAEVWVRLTFENRQGDIATAFRRMECPADGYPTLEASIDSRLLTAPELLETGLLMPARLTRIGFGKKSASLYEAVKMLTGLDLLADIADGSSQLTHRGRRFLKYGTDQGLDRWSEAFEVELAKALEKATELCFSLPEERTLDSASLVANLTEAATRALEAASGNLETLRSEIAPNVDIATAEGRAAVRNAVSAARAALHQAPKGIALFRAWAALREANDDPALVGFPQAIAQARERLDRALSWHSKQKADQKFRLKALAAQFFVPPHEHSVPASCPLCSAQLSTAEQQALATQLDELRSNAEEAARRLEDVCLGLESELVQCLPAGLREHRELLVTMYPKADYGAAILQCFCEESPFKEVLVGLARWIRVRVTQQEALLPEFAFPAFESVQKEPEAALVLRQRLHSLDRLAALVRWWSENRPAFRDAWSEMIGRAQEEECTDSTDSAEVQLRLLEEALSKTEPFDALAKYLQGAAAAAEKWAAIHQDQKVREAIAAALFPLKDLRLLVAAETARSISNLSDRITGILERIHLRERLNYEEASLGKKSVYVGGSFEPGMRIDAALVANTSWLRAILWAFILALREEKVAALGSNPFPLMVLDDPQTSFDPRNKRKWAQELTRRANLDHTETESIQLFITTHEREFYQCLMDIELLKGEQGLIGGVNRTSQVATIVNANWLSRAWEEASERNDDARARDYIADVRIYCEDLLKFMLRGEGPEIPNLSLGKLKQRLGQLRDANVAPFNRKAFVELLRTLNGGGGNPMKLINLVHHSDDEGIGVAQASDVKNFWDKKLMNQIHEAFAVYDRFESFYGEPRTFPWAKTVIRFPGGFAQEVEELTLKRTGIAAAAKTGGRAGDGVVTVTEWETATSINLPNHEIYQLAAGTLDPVAGIGDLVIVCNHARVNARNLVVAAYGDSLLARRYNVMEEHPKIAVLTGQSVDPFALPEPRIIAPEAANVRKIVGTLFASHRLPSPTFDGGAEIVPLKDFRMVQEMLDGARLFEVQGRSAEPIALDGQFLITRATSASADDIRILDGRPVVAIDEEGTRYFKRLSCRGSFAVLESLNQDGSTGAELLSFDEAEGIPKLAKALEVIGVLFDLPEA